MNTTVGHNGAWRVRALAAVTAAVILAPATAGAAGGLTASATGSGHTTVAGALRTFSFTARLDGDGRARGKAQVNNRAIGEMFQLEVHCLRTVGDTAIVSGVITRHTDAQAVGLTGIFAARDAGEGVTAPPDQITQVFFFRPGELTCADLGPADAVPFLAPVEAGNVQVR
jgi:hypothetical protein